MSIIFDNEKKAFLLNTKNTSYIMHIFKDKYLMHVYWGAKMKLPNMLNAIPPRGVGFGATPDSNDKTYSLTAMRLEYPWSGGTDYRNTALDVTFCDGSHTTELRYEKHEIIKGKPALLGLPSTYTESDDEADTLFITLKDALMDLYVVLSYTVYTERDVITRSVKIINNGKNALTIDKVLSANVDFEANYRDYTLMRLHGSWARERHIEYQPLAHGIQKIESHRGASSHQANPFIAMVSKDATEDYGNVYAMNFVYSGNFEAGVEVCELGKPRMFMGLNGYEFAWELKSGDEFVAPEVVMVYSNEGLGKMSRTFHDLYRERLVRGKYRDEARPILVNNWEGTYFGFNEEKIVNIAKEAANLGIELMVLDDGWFGTRNDDTTSLGDWTPNYEKLPGGICGLAKKVNEVGLKFGLWFEPEMVSAVSNLYNEHPDWCIHVKDRNRSQCRHQHTLDLSRKDVQDYVISAINGVLDSANISYVKWDMNRHMTEPGSALLDAKNQKEMPHRYMLGLYRCMDEITKAHPDVLFESCSGGGGRFDPGILYYMPQTWTSDDTDAVERLYIQYGTSMAYPTSSMGAHVSAVPNHQVGRITSLKARGDVAMSGNFGYELDLTKLSAEEKEIVKNQVKTYKMLREFVPSSDMYRLIDPFKKDVCAWEFVSKDKTKVFAGYFRKMIIPNHPDERLKFKALDPDALYRDVERNTEWSGDELMNIGIITEYGNDFTTCTYILEKIS